MTSKIKDDIRISQMANGFVVEPDTVFSKSDCYVFQSFESMVEWLREYYMDDGLKHLGHIRTNEVKPYSLREPDPE